MEVINDAVAAWSEAAPLILAALVALTAFVKAMQPVARWLEVKAALTATKWDDDAANRIASFFSWCAARLDAVTKWLPTIGVNRQRGAK